MKTASQIQSMNRKLLLRMRLCVFPDVIHRNVVDNLDDLLWYRQQADLVVKDPKVKRDQERAQGLEVALGVANEPV